MASTALVTDEQIAATLSVLASSCNEAEAGYDAAARAAHEPSLKLLLVVRATERRRFAAELKLLLSELDPFAQRSPPSSRAPGWVAENAANDDRALMERCDRGETALRKAFEAALREVPLFVMPLRIRTIVQRQYAALLASHAELQRALWRQ